MNDYYQSLPILKGENVTLRPISFSDTGLVVKWRNNERVKQNFIYRGPFTEKIHFQWMNTKVREGDVIQYIILYNQQEVGSVYFRDIDKNNRCAEFGIFIGEDFAVGKGIGKEATKVFLKFGLTELKFHRISLRLLSKNEIAHSLYRKVGFNDEGLFKDMVYLDGVYHDVIFMAIINHDEDIE